MDWKCIVVAFNLYWGGLRGNTSNIFHDQGERFVAIVQNKM